MIPSKTRVSSLPMPNDPSPPSHGLGSLDVLMMLISWRLYIALKTKLQMITFQSSLYVELGMTELWPFRDSLMFALYK